MTTAQEYLKKSKKLSNSLIKNNNKKLFKKNTIIMYSNTKRSNVSQGNNKTNYNQKSKSKNTTNNNQNKNKNKMNFQNNGQFKSKTVPLRMSNKSNKLLQFPFEAIKFKQPKQTINKHQYFNTENNFYIQYDEPDDDESLQMIMIDNPKRIINSINHRLSKYDKKQTNKSNINKSRKIKQITAKIDNQNNKRKDSIRSKKQAQDSQFQSALLRVFRFMDDRQKGTISQEYVHNKKLPQAVLYFLGSIFHQIRQKSLVITFKEFLNQANKIYLKSSKEDIKWFINEVQSSNLGKNEQNQLNQLNNQKKHKQNHIQQSKVQQKILLPLRYEQNGNRNFVEEGSIISFRRKNEQQSLSGMSLRSQNSLNQSAKFNSQYSSRNSDQNELNKSELLNIQFLPQNKIQISSNQIIKKGEIRKNILINKQEDLKQQIYAKLQKMKLNQDQKQNYLITNSLLKKNDKIKNYDQSILSINKNDKVFKLNTAQTITQTKQSNNQQKNTISKFRDQQLWVNKNKKIQSSLNDLKKIQQQFNKHKEILLKRQQQRQKYFKDQLKLIQTKISQPTQSKITSNVQQQSRILKIFDSNELNRKNSKGQQLDQSSKYQKNIDRLGKFNKQKIDFVQLQNKTGSLINSCRKFMDVTLPLKYSSRKILSQKKQSYGFEDKLSKLDKIDELSQKIQKYLKKNSEKIQISRHFTTINQTNQINAQNKGRFNSILYR